jgi:alanyl-tRNA synthetase
MRISKKEWNKLKKKEKLLKKAAAILRVEEKDLPRVVERFQKEIKEMEEKLK